MELDQEELNELRGERDDTMGDTAGLRHSRLAEKGVAGVLAFVRLGLHIEDTQ